MGEPMHKVLAPVSGTYVPIEDVADPVFAQKMMGDGFAVTPDSDVVVAPVSGEVTARYPTGHAYGLRADDGLELMVHVGIDTVEAGGDGFLSTAEKGQRVSAGDALVTFDRGLLAERGFDTSVIVVLLSVPEGSRVQKYAAAGEPMEAGRSVAAEY